MSDLHAPLLPGLLGLSRRKAGEPAFLEPYHLVAAERFHRLFQRAHLSQRLTMHYGPRVSRVAGSGGDNDISDMAADARKTINRLRSEMPRDCAQAIIDICGFEKGIQAVETEHGWPRRSGKLVLRIGLDHLARQFRLTAIAEGSAQHRTCGWQSASARPTDFGPFSGG